MDSKKYLAVRYFCLSDQEKAVVRQEFGETLVAELEQIIKQFPSTGVRDGSLLASLLRQDLLGLRDFRDFGITPQKFWIDQLKKIKLRGPGNAQGLKQCLEKYVH